MQYIPVLIYLTLMHQPKLSDSQYVLTAVSYTHLYDNAPMERYFNTLKNECTNLYEFETEKALYQKVEEFAYVDYNHVRPHSFNDYRTPYEARMAA